MNDLKLNRFKFILTIAIILLTLSQCYTRRYSNEMKPFGRPETPTGVVRVDTNNFYIDRYEITNFNWAEYVYWVSKVYGHESEIYKSVLPIKNLEESDNNCNEALGDYYYRHPYYQNYPVIGITQEQAKDYCIWRTNIVFQFFLIREEVFDFPNQDSLDSTNYFTVEKYFNGNFNGIEPDTNFMMYALYELPAEQEWISSQNFFLNTYMNDDGNFALTDSVKIQFNKIAYCDSINKSVPTINVTLNKKFNVISHMYGNVAEWLKEDDKIIGGSWKDSVTTYFTNSTIQKKPSTSVGFRCICKWVKYSE